MMSRIGKSLLRTKLIELCYKKLFMKLSYLTNQTNKLRKGHLLQTSHITVVINRDKNIVKNNE